MAWPVSRESVKSELLKYFPYLSDGATDKYLDAFTEIGYVMGSPHLVSNGLQLIEYDLVAALMGMDRGSDLQRALTRRTVTKSDMMRTTKPAQQYYAEWRERMLHAKVMEPIHNEDFSHLVTKEFGALELQGGFWTSNDADDPTDPPYKVMLMTPLASQTFIENLTHVRPWKDIVGPDHGEYTHRLQWCVLIKGKHVDKYAKKPADVFQHIGELKPMTTGPTDFSFTVWDALFDRIKTSNRQFRPNWPFWAEDKLDFRCPEVLLDWLCLTDQQKAYPVLAGFLKARKEKRVFQQSTEGGDFAARYLARKVFGQELNTLSDQDQALISNYLSEGVSYGADPKKGVGLLEPTPTGYQHPDLIKK